MPPATMRGAYPVLLLCSRGCGAAIARMAARYASVIALCAQIKIAYSRCPGASSGRQGITADEWQAQIKTSEAQNQLLNRSAAILTAAGPRMRACTWPPTEKAPLESVRHCWGGRVSHDAVGVSHEAVTRLRRVVRRRTHMDCQGNVPCSGGIVSG
jgi:hypothetical protein